MFIRLTWVSESSRVAYPEFALRLLQWGDIRWRGLLPGQLALVACQQRLSILKGRLQLVGILHSKTQVSAGFRVGVNFPCKLVCVEKDSTPDGHTFPERAGEAAPPLHISCWQCPPCCWAGVHWHRLGSTPKSSSLPALWTSSRVRSCSRWLQCPDGGKIRVVKWTCAVWWLRQTVADVKQLRLPSNLAGGQRCPALACSVPLGGALWSKWPFPVCPGHWPPYPDWPSSGDTAAPACLRSCTIRRNMSGLFFSTAMRVKWFLTSWFSISNLMQNKVPMLNSMRYLNRKWVCGCYQLAILSYFPSQRCVWVGRLLLLKKKKKKTQHGWLTDSDHQSEEPRKSTVKANYVISTLCQSCRILYLCHHCPPSSAHRSVSAELPCCLSSSAWWPFACLPGCTHNKC